MNANFLLQIPASNPRLASVALVKPGLDAGICLGEAMKEIPLTQGQVALVDDEDYEELNNHKWLAGWYAGTNSYRAQRSSSRKKSKRTVISMSRAIMNAQSGQEVDHRNHNTLDNRRENLRICTHSENQRNKSPQKHGSNYKGVTWCKAAYKWRAQIRLDSRLHFLGYFSDEIEAAHVYDSAARKLFGEFAYTNF